MKYEFRNKNKLLLNETLNYLNHLHFLDSNLYNIYVIMYYII